MLKRLSRKSIRNAALCAVSASIMLLPQHSHAQTTLVNIGCQPGKNRYELSIYRSLEWDRSIVAPEDMKQDFLGRKYLFSIYENGAFVNEMRATQSCSFGEFSIASAFDFNRVTERECKVQTEYRSECIHHSANNVVVKKAGAIIAEIDIYTNDPEVISHIGVDSECIEICKRRLYKQPECQSHTISDLLIKPLIHKSSSAGIS